MENGKRTTTYENESEKERIDGNEDEEIKKASEDDNVTTNNDNDGN